jgi:hypothetical protein
MGSNDKYRIGPKRCGMAWKCGNVDIGIDARTPPTTRAETGAVLSAEMERAREPISEPEASLRRNLVP